MSRSKPLTLFNEDGSQIGYFNSYREAAAFLEVNPSTLTRFIEYSPLPVFSHPKTDKGYQIREGHYIGPPLKDCTRRYTREFRVQQELARKDLADKRVNRKGKVYQWDLDGNLVATYRSGTEASKMTGFKSTLVYLALNPASARGEACGFFWSKSPEGPKRHADRKPNAGSPATQ